MPSTGSKAIAWCYTLNAEKDASGGWKDWTPEELKMIPEDKVSYHVFGKEVAPDTGRPHLQGFVIFKNRIMLAGLKKFNKRAHWEVKVRGSTYTQAADYCKKDGDFTEFGQLPPNPGAAGGQATKERYEKMWVDCKKGDFEAIDKDLLIRHYHTAKRIRQDFHPRCESLPNVCGHWFYGKPNTGKSFWARHDNPNHFVKPCNKWWDGYQGEDVVILDDFDKQHNCLGHHLKTWADRYAIPAEMKGTTVNIRPKKLIVTSNYTIEEIFGNDSALVAALTRRYTVRNFDLNPPPRIDPTTNLPETQPLPDPLLTTPRPSLNRSNAFSLLCQETFLNPPPPVDQSFLLDTPIQPEPWDSELSISDEDSDFSYFMKSPLAYTQEIHSPSKKKRFF